MEPLIPPLGLLVGLLLGTLGAGGSILTVPILVYVAGLNPKVATTASLAVVGVISLGGVAAHWKAGRVRVASGVALGLSGIVGSVGGSHLNRAVASDVLLLSLAGLMVVAAWSMLRRREERPPDQPPVADHEAPPLTIAQIRVETVIRIVIVGSVVGFITGFYGMGGGFIVVPALTLVLRVPMNQAVGTSLLVIVINSAVALASRLDKGSIPLDLVVPFALAGLVGVIIGNRIAGRVQPEVLTRSFAGVIMVIAAYTAVRSIAHL